MYKEKKDSGPMSSDQFQSNAPDDVGEPQVLGEVEEEEESHPFDVFELLGVKTAKALKESAFVDLEGLASATDNDLKAIKGIGARSINPIRGILADAGFDPPEFVPIPEAEIKKAVAETQKESLIDKAKKIGKKPAKKSAKKAVKDGELQYVSTLNLVTRWEGDKYNFVIGEVLNGKAPPELIEYLVAIGDAEEVVIE